MFLQGLQLLLFNKFYKVSQNMLQPYVFQIPSDPMYLHKEKISVDHFFPKLKKLKKKKINTFLGPPTIVVQEGVQSISNYAVTICLSYSE